VDATVVKHEEDCLVQDSTLKSLDGIVVVELEKVEAGSCMRKTMAMSTAHVVLCKTLVDGVELWESRLKMQWSVPTRRRPLRGLQSLLEVRQALAFEEEEEARASLARRGEGTGTEPVWDVAGLRETEVAGSDYDGKQRKGCNHVDVLRRKNRRWARLAVNRVDVLQWEAEEDRRKGAAGARRKIYCVAARNSETLGRHGTWSIRGRRVYESICRAGDRWCQRAGVLARLETGEAAGMGDFARDLFWRNRGCQGCRNCSSTRYEKLSCSYSFTEKEQMMPAAAASQKRVR
ncbi:hypothetical protein BHE74_00055157, partial [Ensete ventricosum]